MPEDRVPSIDEVRDSLDELAPLVVKEFIELYHKQSGRDFCSHPEKVAALVENSQSFQKRFALIKFVAMDKEARGIGMEEIRSVPRELDVVKQYRDEADDNEFCWKIGAAIGKYSILKATAYQTARRIVGPMEPQDFTYVFNLENYNQFFGRKEFDWTLA